MKTSFLILCLVVWLSSSVQAVVVSNVGQLVSAIENANNGGDKTILLTNGTYPLTDSLLITADGITVQSVSGNREQVIIRGQGMTGGVTHIFNVAASYFTVKDMTIGWVANHAIQIWGNTNSSYNVISNMHIVDAYEQLVKVSYDAGSANCSQDCIMENCLLEYTAGVGPQYYIGGIDAHQAKNWIVRHNIFRNISSPSENVAEHAIHFWSDSRDTLVESNLIINCDRGIGFGLGERGHWGGIIRNNMIYHSAVDSGFADVAIGLENAAHVQVYNNTIYIQHAYPNAIEYRFAGTEGGIIKNNLCNKRIYSRDGGTATLSSNITNALASWFKNVSTGDLHLVSAITQVVDKGEVIAGLSSDFDSDVRPQGAGIDIGADEYTSGSGSGVEPPFGVMDTPLDGASVSGSIAVTGWALDDLGVTSLKIYRNPIPGAEIGLIYIGEAVFVNGARPDVSALYPNYPNAHLAGWGYMLLTHFLPGDGRYTLYAIACDGSGNQTTLGSKEIICDNAHAVKPFGAIDTPGQGGLAAGSNFMQWGWVLTPPPAKIPINGSTLDVWVDGVALGHPTYNLYRSDIATLFPNYANSNGAVGYFLLNTTTYSNGVHTIQWTATDSAGHTDGIGSRYFTINNIGHEIPAKNIKKDVKTSYCSNFNGPLLVRTGFDVNRFFDTVLPDFKGIYHIMLKPLERLEVCFPGVTGNLSSLPIGATMDIQRGVFYWMPGPGFGGTFKMLFGCQEEKRLIHLEVMISNPN